jgi:hypothetical protein
MCDPGLITNEIFKTIVVKRLEIIMDQRSCPHLPNVRRVHKHNSRVEFRVSMNKIYKGRILDSSLVRIIQELCMTATATATATAATCPGYVLFQLFCIYLLYYT